MENIYEKIKNRKLPIDVYSPVFGNGQIISTNNDCIEVLTHETETYFFDDLGKLHENGEVLLFPSKYEKDWSAVCYTVDIKQPKTVYWYRVTNSSEKNKILFETLREKTGLDNKLYPIPKEGDIYYNEIDGLMCLQPENKIARMAMMVGYEIVISEN